MKKIIGFIAVVFAMLSFNAKAQLTTMTSSSYTVTDAGTANVAVTLTVPYDALGFQYVGTKLGGTMGGTAVLQGSLNGTNWVQIGSSYTNTNVTTNTMLWEVTGNKYLHYRILVTGTGTMSATIAGSVMRRKF